MVIGLPSRCACSTACCTLRKPSSVSCASPPSATPGNVTTCACCGAALMSAVRLPRGLVLRVRFDCLAGRHHQRHRPRLAQYSAVRPTVETSRDHGQHIDANLPVPQMLSIMLAHSSSVTMVHATNSDDQPLAHSPECQVPGSPSHGPTGATRPVRASGMAARMATTGSSGTTLQKIDEFSSSHLLTSAHRSFRTCTPPIARTASVARAIGASGHALLAHRRLCLGLRSARLPRTFRHTA